MKILLRNALIVTMNESNDVIERGAIAIDGKRIAYAGPAEWTPAGPFDRIVEAERLIAIPGMINGHCHSPANLVRGMMPGRPLEIWRAYYRASLRDMREEDFYASALLGGMEMLKNGATTVLDHFFGNQSCRFLGRGSRDPSDARSGFASRGRAYAIRQKLRRDNSAGEFGVAGYYGNPTHERERSEGNSGMDR
jgi:cytosine/adenosine deaminase-related metal-dependent hydrolase